MKLSELKIMVSDDIEFNETELDTESLRIPQLHNKYLTFLIDEKIVLEKYKQRLKIITKDKWLYYSGKMSEEELKEKGWEPFSLNILKSDVDKFLESDSELIQIKTNVTVQEEKINYLDAILKMINGRQWMIRSAIDWIKFSNGIM
jgi:hypothetical protein